MKAGMKRIWIRGYVTIIGAVLGDYRNLGSCIHFVLPSQCLFPQRHATDGLIHIDG